MISDVGVAKNRHILQRTAFKSIGGNVGNARWNGQVADKRAAFQYVDAYAREASGKSQGSQIRAALKRLVAYVCDRIGNNDVRQRSVELKHVNPNAGNSFAKDDISQIRTPGQYAFSEVCHAIRNGDAQEGGLAESDGTNADDTTRNGHIGQCQAICKGGFPYVGDIPGMLTLLRAVHWLNISIPMLLKPSAKTTLVRLKQDSNA